MIIPFDMSRELNYTCPGTVHSDRGENEFLTFQKLRGLGGKAKVFSNFDGKN
jgi:hypothetical protein